MEERNKIQKALQRHFALEEIRNDENLLFTLPFDCKVNNVRGSAGRSPECPNCKTWKKHWEEISGDEWPLFCSNVACTGIADCGGHVVANSNRNGPEYIVPLCSKCNGKSPDDAFTIGKGTVCVSANTSKTCDRLK